MQLPSTIDEHFGALTASTLFNADVETRDIKNDAL